jgi:GTP pyrophosphokinase
LNSGDQVEILTSQKQLPQLEWMNFVTTARAKTKLKQVFKKDTRDQIIKGREMLETYLSSKSIVLDEENTKQILKYFKLNQRHELFLEISRGNIPLEDIDKKAFTQKSGIKWRNYWRLQFGTKRNASKDDDVDEKTPTILSRINRKETLKLTDDKLGDLYSIADCCHPIPGDDVLGYVNDDETVTLHKRNCTVALKLKSNYGERIVSAEWESKHVLSFPAKIEISGIDAQGVLIQIIKVISNDLTINIQKVDLESKDGIFRSLFVLLVHSTEQINELCIKLSEIKEIKSVGRVEEVDVI